ncbi:MAG: endoglucanase, partial [Methanobrevibacter sp.]|nr:endoglucanase [Methanobrevibacter sp.]
MSDDRDKLLHIMSSLEADYKSGKISKEKYIYFRSKYEDKLNSIDAVEATRRIRSMQGKPSAPKGNKRRGKKPAADKKRQEQDLVQKYIINPKKDDAKYN